jgi:hypothetical protein
MDEHDGLSLAGKPGVDVDAADYEPATRNQSVPVQARRRRSRARGLGDAAKEAAAE